MLAIVGRKVRRTYEGQCTKHIRRNRIQMPHVPNLRRSRWGSTSVNVWRLRLVTGAIPQNGRDRPFLGRLHARNVIRIDFLVDCPLTTKEVENWTVSTLTAKPGFSADHLRKSHLNPRSRVV